METTDVNKGSRSRERDELISNYLRIENAEGMIAVYLYACVRVIRISQQVLNRIAWNLVRWLFIIQGPFD